MPAVRKTASVARPPSRSGVIRTKTGAQVAQVGETHGARLAASIDTFLSPHLRRGEKLPDMALVATLIARALRSAGNAVTVTDAAHNDELADDDAPREARDATEAALRAELDSARHTVEGLYGAAYLARVKLNGALPAGPQPLATFASEAVKAIHKNALPAARVPGVTTTAHQLAAPIEKLARELQGHLDDVTRESRELETTQIAKDTALDVFDDTYKRAANGLVGLLRLAGEHTLADSVRPVVPTRGTSLGPDEPATTEPAPTPADEATTVTK